MSEKNAASAIDYYQSMNNKDLPKMEKYLHPEVRMIGPLAEISGKESVFNAVKHFINLFKTLHIRSVCFNKNEVMLAYDIECPAPIGLSRAAVLLTFEEGLIIQYELFYDARPFEKKKNEIFSNN